MKKKKATIKKVAKKTKKKATKKTAPRQSTEIIVRVEQPKPPALTPEDLLPQKENSKYMIPKTWVSEKQVLKIVQKTPPQFVRVRPGRGGQRFSYVPGAYFKRVLNFTFGWNWDFLIDEQFIVGNIGDQWAQVITRGRLIVKDDEGHTITKTDNGKKTILYMKENKKEPVDIGNDYKASATDCLKRCAAQLGIASDVYGAEDIKHETGEDAPMAPSTPPAQAPKPVPSRPASAPVKPEPRDVKAAPLVDYQCHGVRKAGCPYTSDMSKAEYEFSMRVFKKPLCRKCQAEAKSGK